MRRVTVLVEFPAITDPGLIFGAEMPNPGIGGSQFLAIQLSILLEQSQNNYHINIVTNQAFEIKGGQNVQVSVVSNFSDYLSSAPLHELGVLLVPTRVLEKLRYSVVSRISSRVIAHSHHLNDRSLNRLERQHRFAAVACVSAYHYHTTVSRSPRVFLRNIVAPNWTAQPGTGVLRNDSTKSRESKVDLLFLGALTSDKGFVEIAKAWKQICRHVDSVRLHVVGGSATHGQVASHSILPTDDATGKEILRHISLDDLDQQRVIFYGNRGADKAEIMGRCDAALLNLDNHRESFCLAAYECLSLGLPIVGSQAGALREIMVNFPELIARSAKQAIHPVQRMAQDSGFRSQMADRAWSLNHEVQKGNEAVLERWAHVVASVAKGRTAILDNPQPLSGSLLHLRAMRSYFRGKNYLRDALDGAQSAWHRQV